MFTFFQGCGIPPVTLTCGNGGGAHAQNVGPTGTYGCTQPGHCVGPTGTYGCTIVGPTGYQGCTQPQTILGPTGTQGCTQPGHCVGPTGTQGCTIVGPTGTQGCTQPQTILPPTIGCITVTTTVATTIGGAHAQNVVPNTIGCTAITPCPTINPKCPPQTAPPKCVPNTIGCTAITPCVTIPCDNGGNAQAQTIGVTGWRGCIPPTGTPPATVCPQPTYPIGCTGYQGCIQPTGTPPATVCPQPTGTAQAQTIGVTAWRGCPPGTAATLCTQQPMCGPTHIGCTAYLHCPQPGTAATVCTQVGCDGGNAHAQTIFPTEICPTIIGCPAAAHAQNVGPTGTQGCTQPGHCVGETAYPGCTVVGPTGYEGCQETIATVCTQIGCDGGDAQAQTLGHTAYQGCGEHGTAATLCTQPSMCGGPTHLLGCTGYEGCHQPSGTAATLCTQVTCDGGGNAQAQIHSIPVADCIPTRSCTGAWPVC